jgi:hypothetical protein
VIHRKLNARPELVLAVAATCSVALLAACVGSASSEGPTASPSITLASTIPVSPSASAVTAPDDAKSAAQKSLSAYRAMWAAFEKALSIPDPGYPALRQVTTGDARTILVKTVQSAKDKGLKGTGGATFKPEVVEIAPSTHPTKVTIRDCLNTSGSHLVKATPGGTPYKDQPGGRQLTIAIVQRQDDGSWKVNSVGTRDVGTC